MSPNPKSQPVSEHPNPVSEQFGIGQQSTLLTPASQTGRGLSTYEWPIYKYLYGRKPAFYSRNYCSGLGKYRPSKS